MKTLVLGDSGTEFILNTGVTPKVWEKRNEIEFFERVGFSVKWNIQLPDGHLIQAGIDFRDLKILLNAMENVSEIPITIKEFNDYHS